MSGALVHLGAGIGNVVLATPLLVALRSLGHDVDVVLCADYRETGSLLQGWDVVRRVVEQPCLDEYEAVIPAVPPFYGARVEAAYRSSPRVVPSPPAALFYRDEQEYYCSFARALGFCGPAPVYRLPIAPADRDGIGMRTVVLAPGCKGGDMAAKRWPGFATLAARLEDVAIVGTQEDGRDAGGEVTRFPPHARSFLGALTLRETAELVAAAGAVVANDSGIGHMAAALGTPTLMLFGPTPHATLGTLRPNVTVLTAGAACQPCWFSSARLAACSGRVDCLRRIPADAVESWVRQVLPEA